MDYPVEEATAGAAAAAAAVESYVIFDPQQCGLLSVFASLFPDAPAPAMRCAPLPAMREAVDSSWQVKFAMWMMVLLLAVARVLAIAGKFIELWLNTFQINGGLFKLGIKLVTRTGLEMPAEGSDHYWSFIGLLDPRTDLLLQQSCDEFRDKSSFFASESPASKLIADACMMASKLVYENDQIVAKVVHQDWEMHVADTLECINAYQPSNPTRAMIVMDRSENAQAIIVAFQGLNPFNSYNWSSCFDFSWYDLPGIGRVHVGCLEALGLVDRRDLASFTRLRRNIADKITNENARLGQAAAAAAIEQPSLPDHEEEIDHDQEFYSTEEDHHDLENEEQQINTASNEKQTSKNRPFISGVAEAGNRHLAYDSVCSRLKNLLADHKDARLYITGHSTGGAAATIFTSLLFHAGENQITSRIAGVYTFGQPKVGDADFAADLTVNLNYPENRFFRVVYSNDLVARLPYDDVVLRFKHLGPCFFYSSNYNGETVQEEPPPAKNLSSANLLPNHAVATWELLQSLLLRYKFGEAYKETIASTVLRLLGLLVPGVAAHSPVNYIHAIRLGPEILDAEVVPNDA